MLVKQFKPNLNFVLLKRIHEMEAILLRAKDPDIPTAFDVEVVAKGPNVASNIEIGDKVYLSPHPYDSFYLTFDDNDLDIFKIKQQIISPTNFITSNTANIPVLPKPGDKIKFVTYLMVKENDVIATISSVE